MTSNISVSSQPLISFRPKSDKSTSMLQKSFDGYIIALSFEGEWTTFVANSCKNRDTDKIILETSVAEIYFGDNRLNPLSLGCGNGNKNYICTVPFLCRYEYQDAGNGIKLASGNPICFNISISHETLNQIEEKRNGSDLVISVVVCGKITASLKDNASISGERIVSSDHIPFRIPKSDWADSLEKADVCYVPGVESIFCMNELNKSIIDYVKKAKKMYHEGDYDGCVAECRNILETKRLGNKDTKKDQDDDQVTRFKKALDLIKNLTQLAHHKGEGNPKHNFKKLEAKCILAASISFAELMVEGYFDIEDTTEQQNGDQQ